MTKAIGHKNALNHKAPGILEKVNGNQWPVFLPFTLLFVDHAEMSLFTCHYSDAIGVLFTCNLFR